MEKIKIKEILVNTCKKELEKQLGTLKQAMEDAQSEANQHIGAMESRYDSFKEEAQARVSGFAKQIFEKRQLYPEITKINPKIINESVSHGSVVKTNVENYFISAFIVNDSINIDGDDYFPISLNSPLGRAMEDRKTGDSIEIGSDIIKISDVF